MDTDARYWNQIGPHGGWLAACLLGAIRRRHGPERVVRSLNVEFMGRVEPGEFGIDVVPVARQRSVAFERAVLVQGGQARVHASAVMAAVRSPAFHQLTRPPRIGAAQDHAPLDALESLAAFPRMFDYRIACGWPGADAKQGTTAGFVRPRFDRRITPESLAMRAQAWSPAAWAGAAERVPASTDAMSLVFGSVEAAVDLGDDDYLQAHFRTVHLAGGFGDESGALWWPDGRLAVKVQQLVWFAAAP